MSDYYKRELERVCLSWTNVIDEGVRFASETTSGSHPGGSIAETFLALGLATARKDIRAILANAPKEETEK